MLEKDAMYAKLRNEQMLDNHPLLCPNYRTVLFEWLSEVSQECKFYRETYHLAIDLVDRYLAATKDIRKLQLQLIGTTCLFSAAKFEEVRPPTVQEFASMTDGACTPDDILEKEVVILSAVNWELTPMTPNSWINLYMQILHNLDDEGDGKGAITKKDSGTSIANAPQKESSQQQSLLLNNSCCTNKLVCKNTHKSKTLLKTTRGSELIRLDRPETADENSDSHSRDFRVPKAIRNDSFILPVNNGISRYSHKRIASVIDLALLHIESLRFSNSVLTASALYYFTSEDTIQKCTGYNYKDIVDCIDWLEPFVSTIQNIEDRIFINSCQGELYPTQMHSHIATEHLLDKAMSKMAKRISRKRKLTAIYEDGSSSDTLINLEDNSITATPLKSTTVLLTPPSSTRKSRRICQ